MHALLQGHYCRKGSFYPVGGPSQISYNAVRTIERHGGKVLVRAPVTSIIIEGGKVAGVTLKDGDEIRAKQVVSTVGATKTFRSFVPIEHQHMVQCELEGITSLLGVTHGVSLGTLFLGLGEDCPPLPASNTWVFPSYDHDETVNSMSTSQPGEGSPILFISFGSAKDPTYSSRHGGKNSCMVCFPCDYSGVEKYADKRVKKRGAEYEKIKEKIKAKVLSVRTRMSVTSCSFSLSAICSLPLFSKNTFRTHTHTHADTHTHTHIYIHTFSLPILSISFSLSLSLSLLIFLLPTAHASFQLADSHPF
jgi:all-trans-retinol 13,14-reductase